MPQTLYFAMRWAGFRRGMTGLRVVYNETVHPWRVVTAYFDRAMRGKL